MPSMLIQNLGVFSAQAEVFPPENASKCDETGFLRASGGVSTRGTQECKRAPFSPRKRRCFHTGRLSIGSRKVFSAQAEVFPECS